MDLAVPAPFYFMSARKGRINAGRLETERTRFYESLASGGNIAQASTVAASFKIRFSEAMLIDLRARISPSHCSWRGRLERREEVLTGLMRNGGLTDIKDVSFTRNVVKRHIGDRRKSVEELIRQCLPFRLRKTSFDQAELVEWLVNGRALADHVD